VYNWRAESQAANSGSQPAEAVSNMIRIQSRAKNA
jgi:hypothetical protein